MKINLNKVWAFGAIIITRINSNFHRAIRAGGGFPTLIFVTIMTLSFIGSRVVSSSVDDLRSEIIDRRINEYGTVMEQSLREYKLLQFGSIGRIESASIAPIPESAWKQYINIYNPVSNFPSLKYIAVSFGGTPEENRIYFIEPDNAGTKNNVGSTLISLGIGKDFLDKAIGTEKIVTVRSQNEEIFLLAPFYDKVRYRLEVPNSPLILRGFTVTMLDPQKLFTNIFREERLIQSKIQIYLGEKSDSSPLYLSDNRQNKNNAVTIKTQKVPFFDRELTIIYDFEKNSILPWYTTYFSGFILWSGLILGAGFAMLIGLLMRRRYATLNVEKEKDIALAKDELLSLASHQLRTPATGVKQYIGMVLQGFSGPLTKEQREYLERAYASNDRQLHVINDILHLAKLGSGRIVLVEREFDLTKLLREIIEEHRQEIKEAGLSVLTHLPSRGIIFADSHMLRMVFENLLSNAIKYSLSGGTVEISIRNRHGHWFISFADTGIGIAKEDMPKLFKQFSRINNPLTEGVTGSGVGLYLAQHLTQLHGGWIKVVSKPQKGTSFTICLPKHGKKKEKM